MKQKSEAQMEDLRDKFTDQAKDLWSTHQDRIVAFKDESETGKVKVTFAVTLDFSESVARIETALTYSQVVKDKRQSEADDPEQGKLQFSPSGGSDSPDKSTEPIPESPGEGPVEAAKKRSKAKKKK